MTELREVCRLADVPLPGALHVDVDGEPIAIARTDEGVFAIRDVCSHADVRLSEGEVIDCTIECWLHGSQFDLRTGTPLSLPAIVPVPVYPVTIAGEGDDARVLVTLIPAMPAHSEGQSRE